MLIKIKQRKIKILILRNPFHRVNRCQAAKGHDMLYTLDSLVTMQKTLLGLASKYSH